MIFLGFLSVAALAYYIVMVWKWKKNTQNFYPNDRPLLFGHRGSPAYFTENTRSSFKKAIEQGADGLELDIRLSKDKKIIIFHDRDLKRLVGAKHKIKDLTYKQLQEHTFENEETVPLLDDIVPLLDKTKAFNIEIKSDGLFKGHNIIKPLVGFLDKNNFDNKCIVSSFNPLILLRLKLKRPQTIIGYLYNRNICFHQWHNMAWIIRVRPESLHIHYSLLDSWIVRWARKKGMRINSYTINDKNIYENANIDGAFTDNIEYLK